MNDDHPLEIVLAAQADEPGARDALMDLWLPQVLAWCRRLGGPTVDAEDAAHDVLVLTLTKLHTVQQPDRFHAWIFGTTRRVLANHRRRAWVRRWIPGLQVDVVDDSPGPHRRSELSQLSRRVQAVLDTLPETQREVLVLCDVEERADSEVAALLGISRNTVKSRLRLARQRFRRNAEGVDLSPHLEVIRGGQR